MSRRSERGGLVLAVAALALAGCSTAPAAHVLRVPLPVRAPMCDWFTPTTIGGQQVILAVTGPGCESHALIAWIADKSGKPWAVTHVVAGTEFAQAVKGATVVRIYESGSALPTQATGGYLADALQAAGWSVEPPGYTSGA